MNSLNSIILNEDNVITDFNATFLSTFGFIDSQVRNINLFDLIAYKKDDSLDVDKLKTALDDIKKSSKTVFFDKKFDTLNKYFHIEIYFQNIKAI